jgi:hypothetical protein
MNSIRTKRRHLGTYCALFALFGTTAGVACSDAADGSEAADSRLGTATSLDTMDVAILLPLPTTLALAGGLLAPSMLNAAGKPILSRETFASILDARTAKDADGHVVKSGINLSGKRSALKAKFGIKQGPVEFGNYDQWRITSTRLEPCAPTAAVNHASKPDLEVGDVFDASKCGAHLNLVIQPAARATDEMTFFDPMNDRLTMGDYAIHLLFELSEADMRAAAHDFLALKNACEPIAKTDGEPLGVHPCFEKEMASAKSLEELVIHKRLAGILSKYATNLVNAAVMGTDLGQDPWMFYPGNVKSGVFEPVRVFTVAKDPASAPIDSHGNKVRLPFDNARYQMLTLVMAARSDIANPIVPSSADGKDSIVYSFQPPFLNSLAIGRSTPEPFNVATIAMNNFEATVHRLESPARNDFFTVDCVSCHSSTGHENHLVDRSFMLGTSSIKFAAQKSGTQFRGSGTTTTVRPDARQRGDGAVLNFAYHFDVPSVSRRVAYEASLSAAMLNRSFLATAAKVATCSQTELETCLETLESPFELQSASGPNLSVVSSFALASERRHGEKVIAECKKIVCEEKAVLTRLTPKKSMTIDLWSSHSDAGAQFAGAKGGPGSPFNFDGGVVQAIADGAIPRPTTDAASPVGPFDAGSPAMLDAGRPPGALEVGGEVYAYLAPGVSSGAVSAVILLVRWQAAAAPETQPNLPKVTINPDDFSVEQ